MRKAISTQALKSRIGDVVDEVRLRGDRYIIERRGKPVAAIVPLSLNAAYEQSRSKLFTLIETVQRQNKAASQSKIDDALFKAIVQSRSKRKRNPANP
ncbi:MAG: type II toxin-antitoxin system Phd/YefM family antitoxin [Candidatus Sumerlaeaceae bacterium]|nr:type II toxin-antitoxin system Phd/YefM family antitoxin [Candidatus Sumerlaeaceae bacterium]